ncbi:hypothetical protein [Bartonella sp. B1098]|nr:hypothetical protein [Bartonella sp. B1098]
MARFVELCEVKSYAQSAGGTRTKIIRIISRSDRRESFALKNGKEVNQ